MKSFVVPGSLDGFRLDRALNALLPGRGLRAVKRLFDQGNVLVDGLSRPKGFTVSAGQIIEVGESASASSSPAEGVRLVTRSGGLAAVFKPAGVHTEVVAGSTGPVLEHSLATLFPGEAPILLNRLDQDTSGLVLVALSDEGKRVWNSNQDSGLIRKEYLLIVEGLLEEPLVIKNEIDSAHRKKVRVRKGTEADGLRWTRVEPLDTMIGFEEHTVCLAMILKGGRHQIRAHLAFAGHPVVGDGMYGHGTRERLYLHHYRMSMPGFSAMAWPDWPEKCLPGALKERVLEEFPVAV
jgi:23S rRNA pseudouridine1911/1915/1917 synthase